MKYDRFEKENIKELNANRIEDVIMKSEEVLWKGKPVKKAFILNSIVGMLPLAVIWLVFDMIFLIMMFKTNQLGEMLWFIIPFFIFHLMPVWIWISKIITSFKKWENTDYAVTDKRILIRSGFIGIDYLNIYYKDIKDVSLKVGIIDRILNVGDICICSNSRISSNNVMFDITNPYETLNLIQKIVLDIQTDMAYPNDLRPEANHGYNTKYKG